MAASTLSIKLRCTSWQQLATIYRRDLSRGSMFLKSSTQPPLGTLVKIDLELPSATVLELLGSISEYVTDPQRGSGVLLKLEPLPTKTVWLIESALAAENKVRAATQPGATRAPSGPGETADPDAPGDSQARISEGENIAEAEQDLIRALEAEAESLRKLNPFLVLGVGYETTDNDVRAAFGELTKRYHPDRFARYQSTKLRQIAAEIFILIRDAYRKLADQQSRQQVRATVGGRTPPPMPLARPTPPAGVRTVGAPRIPTAQIAKIPLPPLKPAPDRAEAKIEVQPQPPQAEVPTKPGPYDAPTNPSGQSAAIASTQLARPGEPLAIPQAHVDRKSGPVRMPAVTTPMPPSEKIPIVDSGPIRRPSTGPVAESNDTSALEALIDEGKLEEALNGYRVLAKKSPQDRGVRAGIELVEGLKSLAARDRLEAAQRFESALEIDPSNERAARELADMRRQATNERKGLLSRLMGKKEGPP
ncbi:MAG TPA: DnaJ domain-containing protein [Kofleriaceae bacterium]|nr:DnaJ domain-containing protein [Kofleriaceae bacterium]